MRMKSIYSPENESSGAKDEWEMRPGGMLVQKRDPDSDHNRVPPPPTIRVRVKHGSVYHEINISSQASFGELKKMLSGPTGVHHEDQKLFYKDKERDSKAFLDIVGVKDKSKIVLVEDPIGQEKRLLEMRKNAKLEKASKSISDISLAVDRLAGQVSAYESIISKGGKVGDKQLVTLIELLMNQLVKLDGIFADGDVKLKRRMQVTRVQKLVETLDMLKEKNLKPGSTATHVAPRPEQQKKPNLLDMLTVKSSMSTSKGTGISPKPQQQQSPIQRHQQQRYSGEQVPSPTQHQLSRRSVRHSPGNVQKQEATHSPSGSVVITTQWETFDPVPATMPTTPPASKAASSDGSAKHPQFMWNLI